MGLLPFKKDRVTMTFLNESDALRMIVEVDATISAQHKLHAQVTRHPVAQGQALTDNVRPDPDGLTLECYWSNRTGDIIEQVKRYAQADFSHAEGALQDLEVAFRNAWRCTIKMRLKQYEGMVIEDIGVPETVDDGQSVRATIVFTEIRTAVASTANVVQTKRTGIGEKKTGGAKSTKPPTKPQIQEAQSSSSRFLDSVGNGTTLFKKG